MTSKKFIIIAALVLVIVLLGANWTQVKAAAQKVTGAGGPAAGTDTTGAGGSATSTKSSASTSSATAAADYTRVLTQGMNSPEVLILQQMLNKVNAARKGIAKQLVEDGKFGALTAAMLKYYAGVSSITLNQAFATYQKAVGL